MKKINENFGVYFEGKKYSFEIISRVLLDTLEFLVGSSSFRTQKEIAQSNHVSNSYVTKFKREIIYVINYLYDGRKICLLNKQTKKYFEDLLVETFLILAEYKIKNFREYLTIEKIHQIKNICDLIVGKLEKDCSLYLIEIKDLLEKENNISISTSSVHNYLQKYIKWSNKKILYYHPNRFTQRNFEERIEYIRLISEAINTFGVKNIHFMDETGFKRNSRNNGWSFIGTRTMKCDERRINPRWNMFCMINSTGIECSYLINHSAKDIDHAMFMLHDVLPIIQEGQNTPSVIVMDNHPIHKWCENWLSEYFKQFNCHIIYMPVYSPDLNPIEEVFGVLKHYLKNHRDIWGFSPKLSICKSIFDYNLKQNCFKYINKIFNIQIKKKITK
ncbi:integrase protein-related [Anaeramoeba flamelloides]|uniref:Integrase protein-related n=1 Tax=Anaeramoeba flamelloides TaxID=1746091 RepID=A0ABQ8YID4_9EUKA|nr:integrase protein-related [Anaeramoeba flamelloides]